MVDTRDLKSLGREAVPVRVGPPAPRQKDSASFCFRGYRKSRENGMSTESFFLIQIGPASLGADSGDCPRNARIITRRSAYAGRWRGEICARRAAKELGLCRGLFEMGQKRGKRYSVFCTLLYPDASCKYLKNVIYIRILIWFTMLESSGRSRGNKYLTARRGAIRACVLDYFSKIGESL